MFEKRLVILSKAKDLLFSGLDGGEFVVEPGSCEFPVTADFGDVFAYDFGDFFVGVASEEAEFYDFGVFRVEFGELV